MAGMYTWDNVYSYDQEYRIDLSKHPGRSWAVILKQAWSLKLRDRIAHCGNTQHTNYSGSWGGSILKKIGLVPQGSPGKGTTGENVLSVPDADMIITVFMNLVENLVILF